MKVCFVVLYFCICNAALAQPRTDSVLQRLLAQNTNALFQQVLHNADSFRLQIIYTQINRDTHNKPTFSYYYFHYDSLLYFNPASMVKLPLAFLSLEKLQALRKRAINKYSAMQYDSSYPGQKALYQDTTSIDGKPSIAHFIRRAFLISENDPYNRMYQFVGQQTINRRLHEMGYADARITRQFMGFTEDQNRYMNAIHFLNADGSTRYFQPSACNPDSFDFSHKILLGTAHYNRNDSLVHEPFDFSKHNNLSLHTLQQLLQSVLFPKSVPATQRFQLSNDDYAFSYRYLSQFPSETAAPKYDTTLFYNSYVKFFFRDSTHRLPPQVRVFNKVGWSYGFLIDVSYVVDFKNNVEFMLAATLYVNRDGILNDDQYEYEEIGYPFLYQLGQTVYQYELNRQRRVVPNLSRFQLNYEHRDAADTRPITKDVDN